MQNVHVSPSRIRVLVAHPNPVLAAGLESILTREPDVDVIACEEPGIAPSREQLESASIVITECDTGMGVVWHRPQSCRVVIVTADDSEISIRRAMERGASAYLLLAASREHIVRAIRRVHVGKTELDPSVSSKIAVSVTSPTLSPREIEVLWHLMAGCSNKEIARRLMRSVAHRQIARQGDPHQAWGIQPDRSGRHRPQAWPGPCACANAFRRSLPLKNEGERTMLKGLHGCVDTRGARLPKCSRRSDLHCGMG